MPKKKDRKKKRLNRRESQGKVALYIQGQATTGRGKRSRAYAKIKRSKPVTVPQKVKKKDRKGKRQNKKGNKQLDYDKVFYMPNGKGFQVAYRDLQAEITLEDILARYRRQSNKTLYNRIVELLEMEETYDRDLKRETGGQEGSSSGKAGKCTFSTGNIIQVQGEIDSLKNRNNATRRISKERTKQGKKPLWYHEGQRDYWQNITQNGSFFITKVTPRQLLIIACGIMSNVVELERRMFYQALYTDLCFYIPELKNYLPKP